MSERPGSTEGEGPLERGPWPLAFFLWPFAMARVANDLYAGWLTNTGSPSSRPDDVSDTVLSWTTPNEIVLQLPSMQLREFSTQTEGQATIICAPFAIHRALIADFAPGHSLVETLRLNGLSRIFVTDWRSAGPEMRYFSIDTYLADLNVVVDEIGEPVDLVGLCQGGWLAVVYAARFPHKVRRLVLAGAPVDVSIDSELSRMVADVPIAVFDELVRSGGGLMSGKRMLQLSTFSSASHDPKKVLQSSASLESERLKEVSSRFQRWYDETLDLPGTYYLQVVNWIFKENQIAEGRFMALGRKVNLAGVKIPMFILAAAEDELISPNQAFATAHLVETPAALVEKAVEPCGHLSLFMGARSLENSWSRIAQWLKRDL